MQDNLKRKRSKVYTEQCNVRIEPELKADIVYLDGQGIDVAETLRPAIRQAVEEAKRKLASAS